MCDRYLRCPFCHKALVAVCAIAGDNATGFYTEFFLVKPTHTEPHAFVGASTDAVRVLDPDPDTVTHEDRSASVTTAVFGDAIAPVYSEERGFDDDEA